MPPDPAYTMEQQGVTDQALSGGGSDPRMAAPQMDPATMAQLFGDDGGQGAPPPDDQGGDQAPPGGDQAGGQVDQSKLQSVLSDPGLLMAVAQTLKTLGTGDDTDLVHVTEAEKAMLKQAGGQGTPNPTTGLLQYLTKQEADVPDWYSMHPDDRVAMIAGRTAGLPGWDSNWWMHSGAAQGSPTKNMTGEDFANANVAVTPSWGTALNMAGLVTGMATGGPLGGIIGALSKNAVGSLFGGSFGDAFNTPGGRLPPEAVAAVAKAYNDAMNRNLPAAQVMNAGETALEAARGAYGGGPGGQPGGVAAGAAGGIGVDQAGNAYGTNIGGAGMSHNLAAVAGNMAAATAMADRARAFAAGGYGRATPAGAGGNGGGGGGLGGAGGGGDGSGGMGGGAGNKGGGSNRSD
jgi:hypothetical protein